MQLNAINTELKKRITKGSNEIALTKNLTLQNYKYNYKQNWGYIKLYINDSHAVSLNIYKCLYVFSLLWISKWYQGLQVIQVSWYH